MKGSPFEIQAQASVVCPISSHSLPFSGASIYLYVGTDNLEKTVRITQSSHCTHAITCIAMQGEQICYRGLGSYRE